MMISPVSAYTDPIVRSADMNTKPVIKSDRTSTDSSQSSSQKMKSESAGSQTVLTKKERDFFIKMFPQNSDQLERHVLFNRSGRLQNADIQKGTLVDGRV